ncbi:protein of unknown function DUF262 [Pseudodesulfovibrio mercurii]|uniref:GmrSD restriction endonucleases N-terminal domain-containing protein n=1 Tax=Pseudodesulfovibrio mercurii TaxID=641491 RepID=F0JFL9_9BACT|nr:DUF262 domain-containing protein [Pseudodesulfovibrio mercurii]EGB14943.1 protein of unknown function DUF262 [Pseudodesulfovibrio mercurii]
MPLIDEIEQHSATVSADSYSMSINELVTMYKDKEIDIHPEFQRFFRWELEQKSKLIESFLLGIPIPPVFVAEKEDSKWEVIDGLQRLSTVLEVMGEYVDENGNKKPPLTLVKTRYLPDLEGKRWSVEENDDDNIELPEAARIKIKRSRIDISIIKKSSDAIAKYEIFQRLNTGGSNATDQEVRNCIILMTNKDALTWMQDMASLDAFKGSFLFSEKQINESYDLELVTRFIVLALSSYEDLAGISELGDYLTTAILKIINDHNQLHSVLDVFTKVFTFLDAALGENSFRKYNPDKKVYYGASLISIFEVVAIGLGIHILRGGSEPNIDEFQEKHKELWGKITEGLGKSVGSGVRASTRIPQTIAFGVSLFQQ